MLWLPSLTMPSSSDHDSCGDLEVQIRGVDGVVHDQAQHAIQAALIKAARHQDRLPGEGEIVLGSSHEVILTQCRVRSRRRYASDAVPHVRHPPSLTADSGRGEHAGPTQGDAPCQPWVVSFEMWSSRLLQPR